jgi:hypothetical protein
MISLPLTREELEKKAEFVGLQIVKDLEPDDVVLEGDFVSIHSGRYYRVLAESPLVGKRFGDYPQCKAGVRLSSQKEMWKD